MIEKETRLDSDSATCLLQGFFLCPNDRATLLDADAQHRAVHSFREPIYEALIKGYGCVSGAEPSVASRLMAASGQGDLGTVMAILDGCTKSSIRRDLLLKEASDQRHALLPLHWAILNEKTAVVEYLLQQRGNTGSLKTRGGAPVTALHIACYMEAVRNSKEATDIVTMVRASGGGSRTTDWNNRTPAVLASSMRMAPYDSKGGRTGIVISSCTVFLWGWPYIKRTSGGRR